VKIIYSGCSVSIGTNLELGSGDVKREARFRLAAVFSELVNSACRGVHVLVKYLIQYLGNVRDTTPCLIVQYFQRRGSWLPLARRSAVLGTTVEVRFLEPL
jgi:hypothetical protein